MAEGTIQDLAKYVNEEQQRIRREFAHLPYDATTKIRIENGQLISLPLDAKLISESSDGSLGTPDNIIEQGVETTRERIKNLRNFYAQIAENPAGNKRLASFVDDCEYMTDKEFVSSLIRSMIAEAWASGAYQHNIKPLLFTTPS